MNAAKDRLLTFMVGGKESAFAEAKVYLDMMGKNVIHCGAVGTGQVSVYLYAIHLFFLQSSRWSSTVLGDFLFF